MDIYKWTLFALVSLALIATSLHTSKLASIDARLLNIETAALMEKTMLAKAPKLRALE